MTSDLPSEKVAELRQAIHAQVTKMGLQEQIQRCLAESPDRPVSEDGVLALLERRGLVDRVVQSLHLTGEGEAGERGVRGGREGDRREGEAGEEVGKDAGEDVRRRDGFGERKVERERVRGCEGEGVSDGGHLDQCTGEEIPRKGLSPNRRYLLLGVAGGRAFLDHLQHYHTPCSCTLTLSICFRGQRVHSRPVPCACEPNFSETFLLELVEEGERRGGERRGGERRGGEERGRAMSYSDALSISEPVCLVVTRTNERGERDLVGTHSLDWRPVLTEEKGKWSGAVELSGVGHEANISSGLLELRLEVVPRAAPLQGVFLAAQRETERQRSAERERLFLVYSKQWWREYLGIRPEHETRMVKMFALDEGGRSRSVCSFVWPLRAGRLLEGARHAARFVSLLPFERSGSVGGAWRGRGGGGGEVWSSLHTLLSQRKGDVEDHCCLLCSLLLGYGLEAYVCVGSKTQGLAHCWVVTVGGEGGRVTFWESLTGQRYRHVPFDPNTQAGAPPPTPRHPYRTIGCLFNHTSFLANTQPSNSITTCTFDLGNRSAWKPMSSEAIQSVARPRNQLSWSLLPPLVDPVMAANTMELQLRELLTQHRVELGLSTVWDETLCYLLTPALASYELERCVGVSAGNEEFQDAVRGHVQDGHTFKGFPIQLVHRNPHRAFNTCLRSPVCGGIAGCRGDEVRHAVRVKIYCYPEEVTAVWIMFATTYRCIL